MPSDYDAIKHNDRIPKKSENGIFSISYHGLIFKTFFFRSLFLRFEFIFVETKENQKTSNVIPSNINNNHNNINNNQRDNRLKIREMDWYDIDEVMEIELESFHKPYQREFFSNFICHRKRTMLVCETETKMVSN